MRIRHLATFVLALAFAVVFAGPTLAGEGTTTPSSPSSSSGGCLPPSAAADLYLFAAQETLAFEPYEDGGVEACEKICDTFRDTCDDIAHNARVCGNKGAQKFASLVRTTCSTLSSKSDRRACQDDVDFVKDEVRNCTNADRAHARGCCDLWETEVCMKDCLDQTISQIAGCFTGPGGFAGGTCFFHLLNAPL